MKDIPPISALMTPFPYSIDAAEPLDRAREMMAEHRFRHLPVKEKGRLAGVVNERDVERALDLRRGPGSDSGLTVGDVAGEAFIVEMSEPLDGVLLSMASRRLDSALVVKDGRLAGIFTMTDAYRSFARHLRELYRPGPGDEAA